ncbi:MAG: C4-dicarboxylate ABC transporter permease [Tissierellia bacterium]|nr:C4-dicarboxylate ABC transporter permease [Tissierellia bacterium]
MQQNEVKKVNEKKGFSINTYVLLFCILIIVVILTYIIPAGQFERVEDVNTGRMLADPESFHYIEKNPASLFDLFLSIPRGMVDSAKIIFFIFIISGSVQIVNATGAINAGLLRLTKTFEGKEKLLIPIFMIFFSFTGAFLGFSEENIVFVPLAVSVARYLGYDGIVGICISYLATQVGFFAGMMNPFNVGVAQGIANLPMFSGIGFRFFIWVVFMLITAWFVMSYAEKIKKNPELSLVADIKFDESKFVDLSKIDIKLTFGHKLIYLVFIAAIVAILYGAYNFGWYVQEIAAIFLIIGIVSGLICKLGVTQIANEFVAGAKGITFGALIVGVAKGIYLIMSDSMILDTMINSTVGILDIFPSSLSIIGLFIIQWFINIIITSSTGLAAIAMPILTPIADMLKINRQVTVIAFQLGDGINGSILPTSSTLLATCAMADVPFDRWFKFMFKLTMIWTGASCIILIIANVMKLGPF